MKRLLFPKTRRAHSRTTEDATTHAEAARHAEQSKQIPEDVVVPIAKCMRKHAISCISVAQTVMQRLMNSCKFPSCTVMDAPVRTANIAGGALQISSMQSHAKAHCRSLHTESSSLSMQKAYGRCFLTCSSSTPALKTSSWAKTSHKRKDLTMKRFWNPAN